MTREDIPIDTQREQLEDLKEKKIQTRQTNEFSKKNKMAAKGMLTSSISYM